jgi:16S rRNA C967 or C1407 C5-methylase (RsmB/RsmF family)/NOL1/NOP2/fmu family ribosome biogenesis protein
VFPAEFINEMRDSLGPERAERVLSALAGEPAVSVRVNPRKLTLVALRAHFGTLAGDVVPWASDEAFYLNDRPSFTLDPLFHAGAYYVQEASSMYVGQLFERAKATLGKEALRVLDLCAAPGGKTTQLLSRLDPSSLLVANEIVPARATVLAENVARWGCANVAVASSDPSVFASLRGFFDLAVVDAPCSGEGMFRKDERAVAEWSPDAVRLCAARQRRILADFWPALAPGGFLIYSTCTFNRFEDEDNVSWICSELGGTLLSQRHFYPGEDRGEGFFVALIRKAGTYAAGPVAAADGLACLEKGSLVKLFPEAFVRDLARLEKNLRIIASGVAVATRKGRDLVPEADLALAGDSVREAVSAFLPELSYTSVEVSREEALRFLSRESVAFPAAPRGYLLLTYAGLGLGFVKNLGTRTNSLLPPARRIRVQSSMK